MHCCKTTARDIAAAFCMDCGQHLVRCPGFAVCGGLLYPGSGHCREHLKLQGRFRSRLDGLSRDDAFSLELDLTNVGAAGLEITEAYTRLVGDKWTQHQPSFHRLDRLEKRTLPLNIGQLPQGQPSCEVAVACVSSSGEKYLLGTQLRLGVESGDKSVHIEINNSNFAAGATGVLSNQIGAESAATADRDDTCMLDRREGYELELGVRGYHERRARIRRDSIVRHEGAWPKRDYSTTPRPFLSGVDFYLGRNRPSSLAQFAAERQFSSLRFYSSPNELDKGRSMSVSGRQLRFTNRNDQIYVEKCGSHSVLLNNKPLTSERLLEQGDELKLPGARPIRIRCDVEPGRSPQDAGTLILHRIT